MKGNTCLLYSNVNEVYQKLIDFCPTIGFKIKETHEQFYFLRAKKSSIFFWKILRLELEILAVERKKVQVKIMLYRLGKRQPALENDYISQIEKSLNSDF